VVLEINGRNYKEVVEGTLAALRSAFENRLRKALPAGQQLEVYDKVRCPGLMVA